MVDATETLRKLSEKASQLNKSSDEINEIIAAYEKKLAKMKIGATVWLSDPDEDFFDPSNTFKRFPALWHTCSENTKASTRYEAEILGYAKFDDKWQLGRRQIRVSQFYRRESDSWEQSVENTLYSPLSEASRESRVKALGLMDMLFAAIGKKVDEMLKSIEDGKKFIGSIE